MRILVTGANGFIGSNLVVRLGEMPDMAVIRFQRGDSESQLLAAVRSADAVVHLAGVNRPSSPDDFAIENVGLTRKLCDVLRVAGSHVPVVLASSMQAGLDNPYGKSKRDCELAVTELARTNSNPVAIYRLPGVFGKWCRPNYNSVVATFCHNIARDLPIQVSDPSVVIKLVYIDDVVDSIVTMLRKGCDGVIWGCVEPQYEVSLGELARQIEAFERCRKSLSTERVGTGLVRALYATYVSYLPGEKFSCDVPVHADSRGVFVEMLKTMDSGQFSFFTAGPGVTRGGHYHHTKTEKFLVIRGRARFGFRHMLSSERYSIEASGDAPKVVDTIPGWAHDVTNVGDGELVVMLWASEIFDRARPDTIHCKV